MFYAQNLISRKGPLGNIWIAAFCFRKLKKEQIQGTDILSSIDTIMPEIQMPYRVLAQLLVGIVKIFSKKVDYLYHDCNEALDMIRRSITLLQSYLPKETSHAGRYYHSKANRLTRGRAHKPSALRERISMQPAELMHASHDQQTITVPERFELDSFDLQIPDAGDIAENSTDLTDLVLLAHKPSPVREATSMQPVELIRASHDQPAITIPERFDLDSFDFQMSHEGGVAGNSTHLVLEDEWDDERSIDKRKMTPCSSEQHHQREATAGSEFDSPCFTPIHDAILSYAAGIGFENTEALNSGSIATRREIFGSKFEHVDKSLDQEVLSSDTSVGAKMNGGSLEVQLVPTDLAENVPLEFGSMPAEEPTRQVCHVKLKLPELITEKHSEVVTPREHASPDFMVTTPAKKDQRHMSRKRKNFDSSIVVSNATMRLGIHDANGLVCKRRKAPHTCLDAWKAYKITNLRQTFFDPLIPCASLDLNMLFRKDSFDHSPLEKAEDFLDQQVSTAMNGNCNDSPKGRTTISHTPQPSASDTAIPSAMPELGTEEPSVREIPDSGSELELDRELFSNEKNTETEHSWSTRTRAVAKYIFKRYRDLQQREGKGVFSLALLLEGQRRAKCARLFYETLSLKSSGCIDVDQQSPYGDIIVLPSPKLEVLINDR